MSAKLNLDVDDLRRLYVQELKTLDEIAHLKNTTKRSIANWLIRAGIPRRSYRDRYNPAGNKKIVEYLRDWRNQTAYIIGYIYADGSLDVLNDNSKGVSLSCTVKDREIIDGIAKEFGISDKVAINIKNESTILGKYHYGKRTMCRLRFHSNEVVAVLRSYGIEPRKTWLDYPIPKVPYGLMGHFLRGVFDGDGWVSFKVRGKLEQKSFGFLGPVTFISDIRNFLSDELGLPRNKVSKRPGHYSVTWTTAVDAEKLYNLLYPSGDYVHLRRKRELLKRLSQSEVGRGQHLGKFTKGHPYHPKKKHDTAQ